MKIVPTYKLIIWFGVVFLPVSILIALVPETTGPGIGFAIGLVLVGIIDAAVSRNRLDGIRVTMPEVMRLSAGREGELTLTIENEDMKVKRLRLGLTFPREIYSSEYDRVTDLPDETASSYITWPFKALKQGLYLLQNC